MGGHAGSQGCRKSEVVVLMQPSTVHNTLRSRQVLYIPRQLSLSQIQDNNIYIRTYMYKVMLINLT